MASTTIRESRRRHLLPSTVLQGQGQGQGRANSQQTAATSGGRRQRASRASVHAQSSVTTDPCNVEMMPLQRVLVAVLGAPGVGKTSLVTQFVYNDVDPPLALVQQQQPVALPVSEVTDRCRRRHQHQQPRRRQRHHHIPVVVDNRLYDLRLTDCPAIRHFPASSLQEWAEFRGYGLRQAAAYVLVYDVTDDDSFSYVRFMRSQILAHRRTQSQHDVPIVVAANKADQLCGTTTSRSRETVANVVRKQWKCAYVECSAMFNWRVVALFRELMKAVDTSVRLRAQRSAVAGMIELGSSSAAAGGNTVANSSNRLHDAFHNNHCAIL